MARLYGDGYVFGRYQYRREISTNGEVHKRMHAVEMSDWRVGLKQHHEGYITQEEFVSNQDRLQKNRTNGEETVLSGPAREGRHLSEVGRTDRIRCCSRGRQDANRIGVKGGPAGRYGRTPASTKDAEGTRERREEQARTQEKIKRVRSM